MYLCCTLRQYYSLSKSFAFVVAVLPLFLCFSFAFKFLCIVNRFVSFIYVYLHICNYNLVDNLFATEQKKIVVFTIDRLIRLANLCVFVFVGCVCVCMCY